MFEPILLSKRARRLGNFDDQINSLYGLATATVRKASTADLDQTTSHEGAHHPDGLLHHEGLVRPKRHTSDTTSYTDMLFGLRLVWLSCLFHVSAI